MLEVTAAGRADLAGGTLDLWPLYCLHADAVTVNVALAAGVKIRVTPASAAAGTIAFIAPGAPPQLLSPADGRHHLVAAVGFHFLPAGGFSVEVVEQLPLGSGLGGSSVLAVALARGCLALSGRRMTAGEIVVRLRDLEAAVLGAPTGIQDYYPALLGGAMALHLRPGGEEVERLTDCAGWIGERLLIVYSGCPHSSGMVNWEVYQARIDGVARVSDGLERIARSARECRRALIERDEATVGRAIAAEWEARRVLAPSVTTPALEELLTAGRSAGASAGKACGAGGGGSVLFWVAPDRREAVRSAVLGGALPGAAVIGGGVSQRGAVVRRQANPNR